MKSLDIENNVQRVFDVINKYTELRTPYLHDTDFIHGRHIAGAMYQSGRMLLDLRHTCSLNSDEYEFVRIICHEVVHYNHWKLGHSKKFYDILDEVLKLVTPHLVDLVGKGNCNDFTS